MQRQHKKTLLQFIARTGMFLYPEDMNNIVSFIHGYEIGTKSKCDFTQKLRQLLLAKYKIHSSNTGWVGQIRELAEKQKTSWVIAFKKITIEVLNIDENGGVDIETQKTIRIKLNSLISQINSSWINEERWVADWNSFCLLKSNWFQEIWSSVEIKIIKAIDKEVRANRFLVDGKKPTTKLIDLEKQFTSLQKKH